MLKNPGGSRPEITGESMETPRQFPTKEATLEYLQNIYVNPRDICEPPEQVKEKLGPPEEEKVRVEITDIEVFKESIKEKIAANFNEQVKEWRLKFFESDQEASRRCQRRVEKKEARDWGIAMATEIAAAKEKLDSQRAARQAIILAEIAGAGLGILGQNKESELATMLKYAWPKYTESAIRGFTQEREGPTSEVFSARTLSESELGQARENIKIAHVQGWLFEKISYLFPPYIEQLIPSGAPRDTETEPAEIKGKGILKEARKKDLLAGMIIEDLNVAYIYPSPEEQETPRDGQAWIDFYESKGIKLPKQIREILRTKGPLHLPYQEVFQTFKQESFTPLKVMLGEEETGISVGKRQEFDALKEGVKEVLKKQMSVPDALLRNRKEEIIGFVECKCLDEAERLAFLEHLEEQLEPVKDNLEVSVDAQEVEDLRVALLGEEERFVLPQNKLRFSINIKGQEEFYQRVCDYIEQKNLGLKIKPLQTIILRVSADWREKDLECLQSLMQERIPHQREVLTEAETVERKIDVINPETAEVTQEKRDIQLPQVTRFTPTVYIERVDLFSAPELRVVAREILKNNP